MAYCAVHTPIMCGGQQQDVLPLEAHLQLAGSKEPGMAEVRRCDSRRLQSRKLQDEVGDKFHHLRAVEDEFSELPVAVHDDESKGLLRVRPANGDLGEAVQFTGLQRCAACRIDPRKAPVSEPEMQIDRVFGAHGSTPVLSRVSSIGGSALAARLLEGGAAHGWYSGPSVASLAELADLADFNSLADLAELADYWENRRRQRQAQ